MRFDGRIGGGKKEAQRARLPASAGKKKKKGGGPWANAAFFSPSDYRSRRKKEGKDYTAGTGVNSHDGRKKEKRGNFAEAILSRTSVEPREKRGKTVKKEKREGGRRHPILSFIMRKK